MDLSRSPEGSADASEDDHTFNEGSRGSEPTIGPLDTRKRPHNASGNDSRAAKRVRIQDIGH